MRRANVRFNYQDYLQRHENLVQRVAEARADCQGGLVRRGTVEEILADTVN